MDSAGGWNDQTLVEDMDLSLRAYLVSWLTVTVTVTLTLTPTLALTLALTRWGGERSG